MVALKVGHLEPASLPSSDGHGAASPERCVGLGVLHGMPRRLPPAPPRVVVAGAGFGGLWAARALAGEPVEVVLLDRNNYHTFLPLLYQVAAAELGPSDIAYPVRSILRRASNVRFVMAELVGLDLVKRVAKTDQGDLPYDHLVLALGSVPNFFDVEGAAEHAFPLREMKDAIPLRHHILGCFEAASCETEEASRRRLLTFTIVGGGPTGVEYAGALAELVRGPLRRDYLTLSQREVRVVLLEAADGLLQGMPDTLGKYAAGRLGRRSVEVIKNARVASIAPGEVCLDDGTSLSTETVVWTAGVRGDPRLAGWKLPVGRGGRVEITSTLNVERYPEVYVVGDLAWFEQDGKPLAQVAQVAMQQGELAARNILRVLAGQPSESFRYRDYGTLAVIGRNAAVAHMAGRAFRGFAAWLLWLLVHIVQLIGFRNRALVLVNWAWNYVFFGRAVRLILPTGSEADA